jgi:hypothetical protein
LKYYVLIYENEKHETYGNYSRNAGSENKVKGWRGRIQLGYILRNMVNLSMYPQ